MVTTTGFSFERTCLDQQKFRSAPNIDSRIELIVQFSPALVRLQVFALWALRAVLRV
jgi:hypothetical protein